MRWRWRERGTQLGLLTLEDHRGQRHVTLELHYMSETICGFWLDREWRPFATLCRGMPV